MKKIVLVVAVVILFACASPVFVSAAEVIVISGSDDGSVLLDALVPEGFYTMRFCGNGIYGPWSLSLESPILVSYEEYVGDFVAQISMSEFAVDVGEGIWTFQFLVGYIPGVDMVQAALTRDGVNLLRSGYTLELIPVEPPVDLIGSVSGAIEYQSS